LNTFSINKIIFLIGLTLRKLSIVRHFKTHKLSRSIHTTIKNIRGLTKTEIDEQAIELNSDLSQFIQKSLLKKSIKQKRKENSLNKEKLIIKKKKK
jgi:hypothetical protein